ncbi:DNA polymerase III subunit chi [Candidatus Liberibacter sp.]|uniref:DNA polymerase III subunit chi n=1 Tax=Candidatus Liberibacter sp. TaxID=34022 RepID=UPI0015F69070|nr:DNA polymerase III subunit chi [Candidatus Liberibacter sp.]MBA5723824.1 DNA polymerase III subunit chi [Candidatus Liberibacter sp.]
MTKFFFYLSQNWQKDLLLFLEKSYRSRQRVVVQCGSEEMRDVLNEYLWTWKADSFLPHGVDVGEEGVCSSIQPILLTISSDNANLATVRFFVDNAICRNEDIDLYNKLVFIMDSHSQESLRLARKSWQYLKNQGYKLAFKDISQTELGLL